LVDPRDKQSVTEACLLDRRTGEETVSICLMEEKKSNLVTNSLGVFP
jgi:hypothetical protein